jgi:hypothetical protein
VVFAGLIYLLTRLVSVTERLYIVRLFHAFSLSLEVLKKRIQWLSRRNDPSRDLVETLAAYFPTVVIVALLRLLHYVYIWCI